MNYDITGQYFKNNLNLRRSFALTELGFYHENGFGVISGLTQWEKMERSHDQYKVKRLESYWLKDFPERMQRFKLGDAINRAPLWGGNALFAGIQWQSNFATQPNFITFPLPQLSGEIFKSTKFDIYVNRNFHLRKEIPPGPFQLENIPVMSGSGEIVLLTEAKNGKQQLIALPYYASPFLLKPGLEDYSFEAGALRKDFGIKDFSYGDPLGVATYRRGIADCWTMGMHGEATQRGQNLGTMADIQIGHFGILSASIAGSYKTWKNYTFFQRKYRSKKLQRPQKGALFSLGFHRQAEKLSFSFNTIFSKKQFWRLGMSERYFLPMIQNEAFLGYSPGFLGQFTAQYVRYKNDKRNFKRDWNCLNRDGDFLTLGFNTIIWKGLYFAVRGALDLKDSSRYKVFFMISLPLGKDHHLSSHVASSKNSLSETVRFSKHLPIDRGWGYSLTTIQKQDHHHLLGKNKKHKKYHKAHHKHLKNYYSANLDYGNAIGKQGIRVAHYDDHYNLQGHMNGSIALVENKIYLGQYLTDAFGVIEVSGYKGIKVYRNNQFMGKTDRYGFLFVNHVLPYQKNAFRIDPKDLPLNAVIEDVEIEAIPSYRSAIKIKFIIKERMNISLMAITDRGKKPPIGAEVTFQNKSYLVGYDGRVYITDIDLKGQNDGGIQWQGTKCHF